MNNKGQAYEQYIASQPVIPRPERVEPEPWDGLNTVEITIIVIFAIAVVYAVHRLFRLTK